VIVCCGDSITAGQYLPEGEKSWPALVTGHELIAAGVPSDTTRLGIERFPRDVQERLPQGVIIQFGHNDCNRWDTDRGLPRVSLKAYTANLEEMVQRCRTFGAQPFLCTLTESERSERHATDVRLYSIHLHALALRLDVPLIDARYRLGFSSRTLLMEDGLHLNQEGHRLYALAVQEVLDEWFD